MAITCSLKEEKKRIQETLNLSMCTNSSTDTNTDRNREKGKTLIAV